MPDPRTTGHPDAATLLQVLYADYDNRLDDNTSDGGGGNSNGGLVPDISQ